MYRNGVFIHKTPSVTTDPLCTAMVCSSIKHHGLPHIHPGCTAKFHTFIQHHGSLQTQDEWPKSVDSFRKCHGSLQTHDILQRPYCLKKRRGTKISRQTGQAKFHAMCSEGQTSHQILSWSFWRELYKAWKWTTSVLLTDNITIMGQNQTTYSGIKQNALVATISMTNMKEMDWKFYTYFQINKVPANSRSCDGKWIIFNSTWIYISSSCKIKTQYHTIPGNLLALTCSK